MDIINNILDSLVNSFDFVYCFIVNVLTYIIIKVIESNNKHIKEWSKRLILVIVILLTGVLYKLLGDDIRIIINSAILAPVSWTWIFKPICKLLRIDYNNKLKEVENGEE